MRELCLRCLRPQSNCYCRYIRRVDSGMKFVFLMHPKEAKRQRTGTGRLAHLCLPESEILVGIDFSRNERLLSLLEDPRYYPVLMYPDPGAKTARSPELKDALSGRTLLVIIIDSTWFCSKKIIKSSVSLSGLPRISFYGEYKSIFTFKREPDEHCVSTIESCYYLIKEMRGSGVTRGDDSPEPLMDVFKRMIQFQLQKENDRVEGRIPSSHATDWKYSRTRDIPEFEFSL